MTERKGTRKERMGASDPDIPFWLDDADDQDLLNKRTTEDLNEDVVHDVVIIGGGMTGMSAAYHCMVHLRNNLPDNTFRCTLMEKGMISCGATGRNGGFICPGTSEKYSDSCKRYGSDETKKLFDYTMLGTKAVSDFVDGFQNSNCDGHLKSKAEVRFNGSVSLALTETELVSLRDSYEFMKGKGIDVEWWTEDDCLLHTKSSSYLGGLFKPYGGNLWAAKVVCMAAIEAMRIAKEINESAAENGNKLIEFNLHAHTNVISVHGVSRNEDESLVENNSTEKLIAIKTDRGTVLTKKVLHATNGWARTLLPQLNKIVLPVRNQVIITRPVEPMWTFGLGANYGYEYFMQRPDGRIVLGGMRNLSPTKEEDNDDQDHLDTEISRSLRQYLPLHFPDQLSDIEIEREWAGVLAFTPDRNPIVGSIHDKSGTQHFVAFGYSGHGMPLAFLVGKQIMNLMIAPHPDITCEIPGAFSPSRFQL